MPIPQEPRLAVIMSINAAMTPELRAQWEKDLKDVHVVYEYDTRDEQGIPEKWRYEAWFFAEVRPNTTFYTSSSSAMLTSWPQDRVVYKIHGGPMAGRENYQTCSFQCIRPGELWQCNWLEGARTRRIRVSIKLNENAETGTIVSMVYDIANKKLSTFIAFSKGEADAAY